MAELIGHDQRVALGNSLVMHLIEVPETKSGWDNSDKI